MPFKASGRGAYGPQGQKVVKGPLAPVWVTTSITGTVSVGNAYSVQLTATDDSGDAPTYSLATGSLPGGITLSSSGLLSGTSNAAGTFNFTVRATDVNGRATDSTTFTVTAAVPVSSYLYASSTTVSLPAGNYRVATVGGGGGGAAGHAGGGGAGRLAYQQVGSVGATNWTINVGGGGGGGSGGTTPGSGGGTSSVVVNGTTYASASGGDGGTCNGGAGSSGGGGSGNAGNGGAGGSNGNSGGGGSSCGGGGGVGTAAWNSWKANIAFPVTNYGFNAGSGGNETNGSHDGGGGGGGVTSNVSQPGQQGGPIGGSSGVGFGAGGYGGGYNGSYWTGGSGLGGMVYIWTY